jgi:hypothetical protein
MMLMEKPVLLIMISLVIAVAILIIIFFPKQECGYQSLREGLQECVCIGTKTYSDLSLGGGPILCKGICLKNNCKSLSRPGLPVRASLENPILLESSQIYMRKGYTYFFEVAVFNNGSFANNSVQLSIGECLNKNGEPVRTFSLVSSSQPIPINNDAVWIPELTADESSVQETYVCEVIASDGTHILSRQFFIEVK